MTIQMVPKEHGWYWLRDNDTWFVGQYGAFGVYTCGSEEPVLRPDELEWGPRIYPPDEQVEGVDVIRFKWADKEHEVEATCYDCPFSYDRGYMCCHPARGEDGHKLGNSRYDENGHESRPGDCPLNAGAILCLLGKKDT